MHSSQKLGALYAILAAEKWESSRTIYLTEGCRGHPKPCRHLNFMSVILNSVSCRVAMRINVIGDVLPEGQLTQLQQKKSSLHAQ
jgi:hypothetical protein